MQLQEHLSKTLSIKEAQVETVLRLLSEGSTIPFIARYRKDETGNLSDITLRKLLEEKERFEKLSERKETVLHSIKESGKLTEELKKQIEEAPSLSVLETLYRPYRPKRKTRGSLAKDKGLSPLASYIKAQKGTIAELKNEAASYIDEKKGVKTAQEALDGAYDILAEEISDDPSFYSEAKNYINRTGHILAKETKEDVEKKYASYDGFDVRLSNIKPHQTLALLRGKKEKKLAYSFEYDEKTIENAIARSFIKRNSPFESLLRDTIEDAYKRLLAPSLENEITAELFEKAEESSLTLFGKNLKQLLLTPPLKGKSVLGFDPGYRNGCKLALIDQEGNVLSAGIIYPTIGREREALSYLESLYKKHPFNAIALGNGTASRESEAFLQRFLEKCDLSDKVSVTIVNESGASVYSASPLASLEFPNMDIEERSAVSLARRLLDPLAELVKIPPEAIGVGQYQHDMDEKRLKATLEGVTIDTVNEVGVWLNTASFSLLSFVSGISLKLAKEIVTYRTKNGPFKERKELLNVPGLGKKTFQDAAGFLRIENENPFERTAVHPEEYEAASLLLKKLSLSEKDLGSEKAVSALSSIKDFDSLAQECGKGPYALKDIVEELKKPGRDPREKVESALLSSNVKRIEDLKIGMRLYGTVRNLSDFGAFVDIGVHQDGLVHISEIANRFIKTPSDVLSLGQIIEVLVIGVDIDRKRISLSIKRLEDTNEVQEGR